MKLFNKTILIVLFITIVSCFKSFSQGDSLAIYNSNFNQGFTLFKQNQFQPALPYFQEANRIANQIFNEQDEQLALCKFIYSITLLRLENCKAAIPVFNETLQLLTLRNTLGPKVRDQVIFSLAVCYNATQEFDLAREMHQLRIDDAVKNSGKSSVDYADKINQLAQFLESIGDFEKAMPKLMSAKEILEKESDTTSILYGKIMSNIGLANFTFGNYDIAEKQYQKALKVESDKVSNESLNYGSILGNLATLYHIVGKYDKAKSMHLESLLIKKELLTENNSTYAKGLMNYGNYLLDIGDLDNASIILTNSSRIVANKLGVNHLAYAEQLMNLGQLYFLRRDFKKAIGTYEDAAAIYKSKAIESNIGYGIALAGVGLVYKELGDFDGAIEYQLNALEHIKKIVSDIHFEYGKVAQNLGQTYNLNKDYENALKYYNIALINLRESVGAGHYLFGVLTSNLIYLLIEIDNLPQAKELVDLTLRLFDQTHGKESSNYAFALQLQSLIYSRNGEYRLAINTLNDTMKIFESTIGKESDAYIKLSFLLGWNYELLGDFEAALSHYITYNEGILDLVEDVFTYRSEADKKKYTIVLKDWLIWFNSLLLNPDFKNEKLAHTVLNNEYIFKGMLLNSSKDILNKLGSLNSNEINESILNFRKNKNYLTKELVKPINRRNLNTDSLKNVIKTLEVDLVKQYNGNFDEAIKFNKDWRVIQQNLDQDEIAIEFTYFRAREGKTITNKIIYLAFVIGRNWEQPKIVTLFEESKLKKFLEKSTPNQLYKTRGSKAKSVNVSTNIYNLIWKPLEDYVSDFSTIYYSPVGLLNQIPFAALNEEGNEVLTTKYNLIQLSSTSLLEKERLEPKTNNTMFLGGIEYDFKIDGEATYETSESREMDVLRMAKGTRSIGTSFDYLPGSLREVINLQKLFKKNNKTYSSLIKSKATEEAFKKLSGESPSVLHIATHGFFFEYVPDQDINQIDLLTNSIYKASEDPLMRSGLVLAGANYAWTNKTNPYRRENGILTAMEISNLDLSNTDMVVLSACETGLGDIDGSEGVYGLQRAFKMAGVNIIVMSLWEVPDKETAEFMNAFYSNWLNGMKIRQAFNQTQRTMSSKYKDQPEKWAAFVLFE